MSTPPDNTDRSARYNLHKPGGNYTGPVRPLTEGLAAQGLGVIDDRALCFIAAAAGSVGEPGGASFDDTLPPEMILPESLINITDVQALGSFSWSNDRDVDVLIPGVCVSPCLEMIHTLNHVFIIRLSTHMAQFSRSFQHST
jgi:hypothetical protein